MAVTCCVGDFAKRLGRLPADKTRWREALAELPGTCDRACSPGGCRKHCTDYAKGAWLRAEASTKQAAAKPPKGRKR